MYVTVPNLAAELAVLHTSGCAPKCWVADATPLKYENKFISFSTGGFCMEKSLALALDRLFVR